MFFEAGDMGYVLRDMPLTTTMALGMALIITGVAAVVFGLSPSPEQRRTRVHRRVLVSAMDDTKIGRAHLLLMAVLTIAIAVDSQKPFTFTFILPGVAREYGLSSPGHHVAGALPVALYPFIAIIGTVLGSLLWGYIGDRLGRRTAILLCAILFMATSICGAMPLFSLNLFMCFFMGVSAGGLLPTAYALLTEIIPARRRGQIVVLVAGIGTGLGFLLTSSLATWLMPHFGWRIMWFFGLPTGLALVVLNRFIPESPRFLVEYGRAEEAEQVMKRFGARLLPDDSPAVAPVTIGRLFTGGLGRLSIALCLYGLAWGVVNFGFLTWLPTSLGTHGLSVTQVSGLLTNAAFFSLPGAFVVAWLYGYWSSKFTMVLMAALTAASLGGFLLLGDTIAGHTTLFAGLLIALLVSLWGVIAVLAPYSAEVYPTRLRSRGAGLAAGASKLGGVIALGMGVAGIAPPGIAGGAALAGGAMVIAAIALSGFGIETRRRRLEEIKTVETAVAARA
jgi:putative MFS transporter